MGSITNMIKSSSSEISSRLKNTKFDTDFDIPDIGLKLPSIPNPVKDIKPDLSKIKVPQSVSSIATLAQSAIDSANSVLPSEIAGFSLPSIPSLPDIGSKISTVEKILSANSFDLSNIGLEQITGGFKLSDFVKTINLNGINSDLGDFPDFSSEMNKFDASGIESEINSIGSGIPGFEDFDITSYV